MEAKAVTKTVGGGDIGGGRGGTGGEGFPGGNGGGDGQRGGSLGGRGGVGGGSCGTNRNVSVGPRVRLADRKVLLPSVQLMSILIALP